MLFLLEPTKCGCQNISQRAERSSPSGERGSLTRPNFEPYPIPVLADPKKIIRALAQLRDLKSFVSADVVNTSPQYNKYVSA
jgi:hypothetical protein